MTQVCCLDLETGPVLFFLEHQSVVESTDITELQGKPQLLYGNERMHAVVPRVSFQEAATS